MQGDGREPILRSAGDHHILVVSKVTAQIEFRVDGVFNLLPAAGGNGDFLEGRRPGIVQGHGGLNVPARSPLGPNADRPVKALGGAAHPGIVCNPDVILAEGDVRDLVGPDAVERDVLIECEPVLKLLLFGIDRLPSILRDVNFRPRQGRGLRNQPFRRRPGHQGIRVDDSLHHINIAHSGNEIKRGELADNGTGGSDPLRLILQGQVGVGHLTLVRVLGKQNDVGAVETLLHVVTLDLDGHLALAVYRVGDLGNHGVHDVIGAAGHGLGRHIVRDRTLPDCRPCVLHPASSCEDFRNQGNARLGAVTPIFKPGHTRSSF